MVHTVKLACARTQRAGQPSIRSRFNLGFVGGMMMAESRPWIEAAESEYQTTMAETQCGGYARHWELWQAVSSAVALNVSSQCMKSMLGLHARRPRVSGLSCIPFFLPTMRDLVA